MTSLGPSELGALAWTDVPPAQVVVVALGATEQHGPHLPLSTDTIIATELSRRLVAARPDRCVMGPVVPVGASGEHQSFAGTLSIGTRALEHLLVELVRSAGHSFDGVVLVNGHGGNTEAVTGAVRLLTAQQHHVLSWGPSLPPGGDLHAGHTETAVLMALEPLLVRSERLVAGATGPLGDLLPAMRAGGVAAVSPNGVLGDPTGSTAEEGRRVLEGWTGSLLHAYDAWDPAGDEGP